MRFFRTLLAGMTLACLSACNPEALTAKIAPPANPLKGDWENNGIVFYRFTDTAMLEGGGQCKYSWRSEIRQSNGQQFEVVLVKCEGRAQEIPFVLVDENTMMYAFSNRMMHKVR